MTVVKFCWQKWTIKNAINTERHEARIKTDRCLIYKGIITKKAESLEITQSRPTSITHRRLLHPLSITRDTRKCNDNRAHVNTRGRNGGLRGTPRATIMLFHRNDGNQWEKAASLWSFLRREPPSVAFSFRNPSPSVLAVLYFLYQRVVTSTISYDAVTSADRF